MKRSRPIILCSCLFLLLLVLLEGSGFGQGRRGRGRRWEPLDRSSSGVPDWQVDPEFQSDVFRFVRIRYGSWGGWGGDWTTDMPSSDWNISYRLQQLTSLKVHPDGTVADGGLELSDEALFDYPFIYIVEPGDLSFTEEEVKALRRYLLNGGFLMVDDFWGEREWDNFYTEIKRVFPEREPEELPLDHEIFRCVYQLKEKPQIPSINAAWGGRDQGITWERWDARVPHYKAFFDDEGPMMVIICHNTDLGDGWEREGEDEEFFYRFSIRAYPLGVNIAIYAMTH